MCSADGGGGEGLVALATPAAPAVAMTAVAARTVRVVRPLAHMLIVVDMVLSRDLAKWVDQHEAAWSRTDTSKKLLAAHVSARDGRDSWGV
jgi:hypothetical protein